MLIMDNEFRGFSLFKDQEEPLRSRNRAVVLGNIAEENMNKEKRISAKGVGLMVGYMGAIPAEERKETALKFAAVMKERHFTIVENPA